MNHDKALANDLANLRLYLISQFPADSDNYELSDDRSVMALVRELLERLWRLEN